MANERDKDVVDLTDPATSNYKRRIEAAKKQQPVGGVPSPEVPRLDQDPPGMDRHHGIQPPTPQKQTVDPNVPGAATSQSGGAQISPQTAEQLSALAQHNQAPEEPPPKEKETKPQTEEDALHEEIREAANKLSNDKRREAIEERLESLDFNDLIVYQELRQKVPIRKGFVPTFRYPSGQEDLFVKRLISNEEDVSERYLVDKYSAMNLCLGLYAINDKVFPSHLNDEGKPDEALFWKKYDEMMKNAMIVIGDLSVNFSWFCERVQDLLSLENIQNF